ncbi:EamA family transporter [Bacillus sp. AG4(2022)]|uniref:DMT family transporter n=1 Tax=Bacillus sp. AG4(2022) TaxID=2962594 RepID=UPI002880CA20|nr:EamA family transporter [Bacillus sp. AG4(2022)]MDT0160199.1 EamA family transporter [Bacillus sp. AG4(2022)]
MKKLMPYFAISAGASLWGLIAYFIRGLSGFGFSSMEIVGIRAVTAAAALLLIGIFLGPGRLALKRTSDIGLFAGTGICSIVFFNWCYFTSINLMDISIAVILLYTSPAFVAVLSYIFLKEKITGRKIIAVCGTVAGCILIAGVGGGSGLSVIGVVTGLGAGLGYALYSIFGKFALQKYEPFTVTLYTFVTASAVLLPVTRIWEKASLFLQPEVLFLGLGLGLLPTVLAYFLYTWGLEKTESSKAAVIATIEPVVAIFMGVALYSESLGYMQLSGSIIILLCVILVNLPERKGRTPLETGNSA